MYPWILAKRVNLFQVIRRSLHTKASQRDSNLSDNIQLPKNIKRNLELKKVAMLEIEEEVKALHRPPKTLPSGNFRELDGYYKKYNEKMKDLQRLELFLEIAKLPCSYKLACEETPEALIDCLLESKILKEPHHLESVTKGLVDIGCFQKDKWNLLLDTVLQTDFSKNLPEFTKIFHYLKGSNVFAPKTLLELSFAAENLLESHKGNVKLKDVVLLLNSLEDLEISDVLKRIIIQKLRSQMATMDFEQQIKALSGCAKNKIFDADFFQAVLKNLKSQFLYCFKINEFEKIDFKLRAIFLSTLGGAVKYDAEIAKLIGEDFAILIWIDLKKKLTELLHKPSPEDLIREITGTLDYIVAARKIISLDGFNKILAEAEASIVELKKVGDKAAVKELLPLFSRLIDLEPGVLKDARPHLKEIYLNSLITRSIELESKDFSYLCSLVIGFPQEWVNESREILNKLLAFFIKNEKEQVSQENFKSVLKLAQILKKN